jgi:ubiquinone/menaquinone biosynthesis C-methylase UbiE
MALPVDSVSVDFVISNGVLNLTPDKREAFGEVFRILKAGGEFLYGDIIVARASFRSRFGATSISGRVESLALCRRQSSSRFLETSASMASP